MSKGNLTETLGTVSVTEWVEDRRRTERVPVSLPVHVCSSDGSIDKFEEVSTTLNASRDGLYFSTDIQIYKVGMPLLVTFPYSHAPERNVHFFSKVVRIDVLPEGHFGIAVELVMTIANRRKLRVVAETVRR